MEDRRPRAAARLITASAAIGLLLLALVGPAARAADDKPPPTPADPPAYVETRHTITLSSHPLDYRAVAETIGLTDPKGEPTASVYTIAYLAESVAGQQRPIAFVFNGGPGAASVFLHLGALGPRVLDTPASGAVPSPPISKSTRASVYQGESAIAIQILADALTNPAPLIERLDTTGMPGEQVRKMLGRAARHAASLP